MGRPVATTGGGGDRPCGAAGGAGAGQGTPGPARLPPPPGRHRPHPHPPPALAVPPPLVPALRRLRVVRADPAPPPARADLGRPDHPRAVPRVAGAARPAADVAELPAGLRGE